MLRVSNSLRHATNLLLCVAAAGCSSGDSGGDSAGELRQNLIQFPAMYTAFDGTHDYEISPWIPLSAADPSTGADPVKPDTIKWESSGGFLQDLGSFSQLSGGNLYKATKPGSTVVKVTATTVSGVKIRGEANVTIEKADEGDWEKGDARYNNNVAIDPTGVSAMMAADGSSGLCGIPVDIMGMIPKDAACANCHNAMNVISIQHTPAQTAGYSDEQLIEIFTQAMKPAGSKFNSPIFRFVSADMAECLYKSFHTWDIPDDVKQGVVYKLRSITPAKQSDIDIQAIAAAAMAARAGGAAGAGN
jgi:hypothetical protein